MRDKSDVREVPQADSETRERRIQQMEQQVIQEVADKDYRNVYLPCLPMDGLIKHWR